MRPTETRRSFLGAAAAIAAAPLVPAVARQRLAATFRAKKKILILGGTQFLGPAIVRAALAQGHELTLFNRGKTNPGLFPEVEKLQGQRRRPRADRPGPAQDLTALQGRKWDAVVDTSAYFTGEVEDVCKILAGNVGHYTFISSLSVYKTLEVDATPVDEQSPLAECADKYVQTMGKNFEFYGALKRYCEETAAAAFPGAAALVRPGYIVGPEDPTDRFTYWPARFLRGGECLAPGDMDNDLQFIDVRDLGAWIVKLIEDSVSGPLNAVGFENTITTAEFLHTGKGTLNHGCNFTWVSDAFLEENGVSSWQEMGCWTPKAKNGHSSNARAIATGLKFRPIAETIRDTAAWVQSGRGDREWGAGMKAEREAELLAKWQAKK
ncbi:MAG: NAD-dependent epimerase/dehydratase family protein [Planctomycetes bacterium]|nr:NAD-dependent epimerase/dehydratase family protein [Planctomycetota bacterium]